jgi:flagellar biosynthetic protein FliR
MMLVLNNLNDILNEEVAAVLLTFARTSGAVSFAPAIGERMLPSRVRLALAVVLTMVVFPLARQHYSHEKIGTYWFVGLFATELVIGVLLGIGLRFFVVCLQMAGSIAAQSTSLSQIFGTAASDPQPAIGHVLVLAGLAVATSLGLHVQIVKFVAQSYAIMSPGMAVASIDVATWGTQQIANMFALGFSIAMPFVIAGLLYNVALGAINRAMPQLMVSFVGAPAIALAGLVLLFFLAPLMISVWRSALMEFMQSPFGYF